MDQVIHASMPFVGYYEDASISCLAVATRRPPGGLFRRCGAFFRELKGQNRLCELNPYLARDIGVAVGCDWRPDGSPIGPFLLWTPRQIS